MQWEGDLRGHVDEALAHKQPNRLAAVIEDLLELLRHTLGGVLLALIHDQLLQLFHTLHILSTAKKDIRGVHFLNDQIPQKPTSL